MVHVSIDDYDDLNQYKAAAEETLLEEDKVLLTGEEEEQDAVSIVGYKLGIKYRLKGIKHDLLHPVQRFSNGPTYPITSKKTEEGLYLQALEELSEL